MIAVAAAATACGGGNTTDTAGSTSGGGATGGSSGTATSTGGSATGGQGGSAAPRCGDGKVDPGEGCDDGNMVDDDACTNACGLPACGDGIVQMGEACDDGNMTNTDSCPDDANNGGTCQTASCGDSFLYLGTEVCDDGNMVDDDGCTNACEGWLKRQPITLTATNATGPYTVVIALNSNNFNYNAAAADGSDLRFGTDNDSLNGFELKYALGAWDPGGTSYVFIRIPALAMGANTVYAFYDFSGSSVNTTSDFNAAFPNQIVSNGAANITGDIVTDFFHVQAGDILSVVAGSAVTITATVVLIEGTINGTGRGNGSKAGPGAGTTSTDSGAGGGSYGATGGKGGFDINNTPGVGGPLYGTLTGPDIDMGSGGGGDNIPGGSGGGSITIDAEGIEIRASGAITANGTAGGSNCNVGGEGRCSGGGSGGGVLLRGRHLLLSGAISASGGMGGQGT
ncbi:MAG: DUF4215 domain-containing protein, partial [Polyangiaceae bacterium]